MAQVARLCATLIALPICALSLNTGCSDGDASQSNEQPSIDQKSAALTETQVLLDWLIQDVCDADPGLDPYLCVGSRHDLQPGEVLRWSKRDRRGDAQVQNSFPVWSDGEVVMNTFDAPPYHRWNVDAAADGYDVVEASRPYVSITDTRDGCGFGITWVRIDPLSGVEDANDAWKLFPTSAPASGAAGTVRTRLHPHFWELNRLHRMSTAPLNMAFTQGGRNCGRATTNCPQCTTHFDLESDSSWERSTKTFTGGQTLDAIRTVHNNGVLQTGLSNTAYQREVTYFTRPYGRLRWETWERPNPITGSNPQPHSFAASVCNGCKDGSTPCPEAAGGWVMTDCRDWSYVFRIEDPAGFDPKSWPAPAPSFETTTYQAEAMPHATGALVADGTAWSAATAPHGAGHMVFGPYSGLKTSAINASNYTATFTALLDYNGDSIVPINLEVRDATTGAMRTQRQLRRNEFSSVFQYQDFALDFSTATPWDAHEFRVYWYDNTYTAVDRIRVSEPMRWWVFSTNPAVNPNGIPADPHGFPLVYTANDAMMRHVVGAAAVPASDGWEASPSAVGHMLYGPYTRALMPGLRRIRFWLRTDNINTADATRVAVLEVNDASWWPAAPEDPNQPDPYPQPVGQVQASAEVRHSAFTTYMGWLPIDVYVNAIGNHAYEFRVWHDPVIRMQVWGVQVLQ